jgi:dTMP kinase
VNFHRELHEAYRQIAAADPARCVLIDAAADLDTVAANIWTVMRERLLEPAAGNLASSA